MYENLKKAVNNFEAETLAKFNEEIKAKTAGEMVRSWYYKQYTTPKTWEALKGMDPDEIPAEWIIDKMKAKKARIEGKRTSQRLEKIARAEATHAVQSVDVSVEWSRSRTWGWNPHATVRGLAIVTTDSASGCGYDKESAAIAGAMNVNPEILRILYDHAEKGEAFPYSVTTFAGLPSFDGGCGVSCFRSVFDACGYEWREVASGKTFDAYTMTRKEV